MATKKYKVGQIYRYTYSHAGPVEFEITGVNLDKREFQIDSKIIKGGIGFSRNTFSLTSIIDLECVLISEPVEKKTVYYAHFMGIYNTAQEKRDIETLEALGLKVINPNTPEISYDFKIFSTKCEQMTVPLSYEAKFDAIFGKLVRECDVFAYRAVPGGRITGGVALELTQALKHGKTIIQLPNESDMWPNMMDGDETRAYLRDMGVR